jgi:hypothetical protein
MRGKCRDADSRIALGYASLHPGYRSWTDALVISRGRRNG